jgi:uncharacterized protein GlcG (DUF336 family)
VDEQEPGPLPFSFRSREREKRTVMKCVRMVGWNRHMWVAAAAISVFVLGAGSAGAADLLIERVLPLSLAREAAQAALSACEARGFHISVAVTDQSGLVRVLLRDDAAGAHTLDSSTKKAYTATSLGLSTAALTKIVVEHPDAAGLKDMNGNILIMPGGLPIKAGTEVIGGIGVGGTPGGDTDEACARAGLDKIADHLK